MLRLAQNSTRSGAPARFARALRQRLTLRDLPQELQRGYPAVRALAVLGKLPVVNSNSKNLTESSCVSSSVKRSSARSMVASEPGTKARERKRGTSREMMMTCNTSGR